MNQIEAIRMNDKRRNHEIIKRKTEEIRKCFVNIKKLRSELKENSNNE